MKHIVTLLVLFIFTQPSFALSSPIGDEESDKHPPFVSFNDKYYDDNGFNTRYLGEVGALSGKIVKIEKGPNDKLIFQLELEKTDFKVWVALLPQISEEEISEGDDITVLGFFDESEKEPEFIAKLSESKEYLLGFCLIEKIIGLPIFYKELLPQCMDWESGNYKFK